MEKKEFCMKQYKPVVAVIFILLIGVIGWTIYHETHRPAGRIDVVEHAQLNHNNHVKQVAAAGMIPIHIGDTVPHGNKYGNQCLMCHSLPGGDQKPAIPAGPISMSTPMPHPFWGECQKCHAIKGQQGKGAQAAYVNTVIGTNVFGAELMTITPSLAQQYNLPAQSGVLVNSVEKGSFAEQVGLMEGDIITDAEKSTIKDIADLSQYLVNKKEGDKLRLKVIRNKTRSKNIKFVLKAGTAFDPNTDNKIGIMTAGNNLNTLVAYSLVNAPYMLVYNVNSNTFNAIENPYKGMPDNRVSNWIISQHVGAVIAGNIGDADLINLNNAPVKVYSGVYGTANDAINLYKQNNLKENTLGKTVAFTQTAVNKLAVAANYPDPTANISQSFGQSHYFLVVELDNNQYEVVTNPNYNDPNGSGIQTAQFLLDNQVDAVVTNQIGDAALMELKKLNIHLYRNVNMSVGDAVMAFKNKKLQPEF
ncbi:MAG: PDZ domain-containing protein [Deltaproteobacteria bacterium]|nr:PDZ domain-containing protein [Deltaproteobacteria bacterium]